VFRCSLRGSALRRGPGGIAMLRCTCCRAMCCGTGGIALFSGEPLRSRRPLLCSPSTHCCTMRRRSALRGGRSVGGPVMEAMRRAAQEAVFCETILAKSGDNVLLKTLRGATPVTWEHYPPGDVFDRDSGAQWYYHCHNAGPEAVEHGHFHCFIRPQGKDGPIHHLVAVGVDAYGKAIRLFTVNQWVVDDVWADADTTIALLDAFDVQMARPSYLVNRWLTAIVGLYHNEIAALITQRDAVLVTHVPPHGTETRQDRALEVVSQCSIELQARAAELGI